MRFLVLFLTLLIGTGSANASFLYVATNGNDENPGTLSEPLASLSEALSRWEKAEGDERPEEIRLRGGTYFLKNTIHLGPSIQGSPTSPLVITGYNDEEVRLSGAIRIPTDWLQPVDKESFYGKRLPASSYPHVFEIRLFDHAVREYGKMELRGYNLSNTAPAEFVQDGLPFTLSRWPNEGEPGARMGEPQSDTAFAFPGERLKRWNQRQDIWVHGQWKYDWADTHLRVKSIDSVNGSVTVDGDPVYGLEAGNKVIFYNLIEELDTPGEYIIDRIHGRAYVWPLVDPAKQELRLTMMEAPLVLVEKAANVTFRNLCFEETRTYLANVEGGRNIRFEACKFRNCGQRAVWIDGEGCGLDTCEIYATGEEGISLTGGSRAKLTPGNNFVTNSRIHDTGRFAWGYHPAIHLNHGCGNIVSHNLIDGINHIAIIFDGNNHTIEGNEIRWACQNTNDAGAIYAGQDWGFRGVKIRGNFIHHIHTTSDEKTSHAIYLDDLVSGQEVSGNILYSLDGTGIFCGGGRDVIMQNNIIANAHFGHYNGDYSRDRLVSRKEDPWNFIERLHAVGIHHREEPWKSAYPECAAIPDSFSEIMRGKWRNPEGCIFEHNIGWQVEKWLVEEDKSKTGIFSVYARIAENSDTVPPLFDEAASLNRKLRFPEIFYRDLKWFSPIRFAEIGTPNYFSDDATRLPPAPRFLAARKTPKGWLVSWTDRSNLPVEAEHDFTLWVSDKEAGPWNKVARYGRDTDHVVLEAGALKPGTWLQVEASNQVGSSRSEAAEVIAP